MTSILFPEQALEVARGFWTHCGWDLDCNTPSVQDLADYLVGVAIQTPNGCPSCATTEAQVDRLTSALDLEAKARYQMAESLAQCRSDLIGLEAVTVARYVMVDTDNPRSAFFVRSTPSGILNLERTLEARYREGVQVGRAQVEDEQELSA